MPIANFTITSDQSDTLQELLDEARTSIPLPSDTTPTLRGACHVDAVKERGCLERGNGWTE